MHRLVTFSIATADWDAVGHDCRRQPMAPRIVVRTRYRTNKALDPEASWRQEAAAGGGVGGVDWYHCPHQGFCRTWQLVRA